MSTTTNMERLNRVVEARLTGEVIGRQEGKTFAACHDFASALELIPPGEVIVMKIRFLRDLDYILPMLAEVLAERGLPALRRMRHDWFRRFDCGGIEIYAVVPADHDWLAKGIVVDFVDY